MTHTDEGGDPACWAHLFNDEPDDELDDQADDEADEPALQVGGPTGPDTVIVDLGSAALGSGGAIWSLPHGGDLDANLVRLDPGGGIGEHVNDEVDVLVVVQSGAGRLTVDDVTHELCPDVLALIPRGARRSIEAGPSGVTYLSVHRRRGALQVLRRGSSSAVRETLRE